MYFMIIPLWDRASQCFQWPACHLVRNHRLHYGRTVRALDFRSPLINICNFLLQPLKLRLCPSSMTCDAHSTFSFPVSGCIRCCTQPAVTNTSHNCASPRSRSPQFDILINLNRDSSAYGPAEIHGIQLARRCSSMNKLYVSMIFRALTQTQLVNEAQGN